MTAISSAAILSRSTAVLPSHSLRNRFITGAFWSIIATALSQGLAFVSYVIAARVLTQKEFGELGIIQSTVSMFGSFAGIGLGVTATKHVAEYRSHAPERAGKIIGLTMLVAAATGVIATLVLVLWSPQLATHTLKAPELTVALRIGAALLFLNTIDGVQRTALAGFEAFSSIARTDLFKGTANLTLVVGGIYYGGLHGMLWGLAGAAAVGLAINHYALKSQAARFGVLITVRGIRPELPTLWTYALPALLSGALVIPAGWFVRTLLVSQPGGYLQMAVFTMASRFHDIIGLAGQTVGAALLPMLASERGAKSEALNRSNILLSWIIGVTVVFPLLCFPELAATIFGSRYASRDAMQTTVLILLCTSVVMYKQGLARVLAARNLMWWGAFSNALWAVTLLAGAWSLIGMGARGLAMALLGSYALNTILFLPLYLRKRLAPPILLASPTAITVWATLLGLGVMSYFGASIEKRCFAGVLGLSIISIAFMHLSDHKWAHYVEQKGVI